MIVKNSPDEFGAYLRDASNTPGQADILYIPESVSEIIEVLQDANRNKTPVTIAGNGTGLNGGRCPSGGAILSMEKLNAIRAIDAAAGSAEIEAGVLLKDFQEALLPEKCFYPPDPTEELCFIGATIATNASGAKSFSYGPTRQYVASLELVLPSGEPFTLERGQYFAKNGKITFRVNGKERTVVLPSYTMPAVKNAAGYFIRDEMDLLDLFIGAEGTLGIIASARLRVLPLPESVLSCVAFFPSENGALRFIQTARDLARNRISVSPLKPRALEFFNRDALTFLQDDYPNIPVSAEAAVWFEQEGDASDGDTALDAWFELIRTNNGNPGQSWFAGNGTELKKLRQFRHALPAKVNEYISRKNLRKLGTDTAVPDAHFEDFYINALKLSREAGIASVAYGHFGNSHLHLNLLPANQNEFETGKKVYAEICREAVARGGTVSAEHGIGKTKHALLQMMYGMEALRQMAFLKKQFDPNCILNIGNIFSAHLLS